MGITKIFKKNKESEGEKVNRTIKRLWCLTLGIILLMFFGVFAISQGWLGDLPPVSDLQNPINKYASRIYSDDGKQIGTWSYATENRLMVSYDSIPENLVNALVATEDVRFYDHSGIDAKALGRAIVKRLIMGQKSAGGGSTLTQQLAKQLYSDVAKDEKKRMMQKPIEWFIAVQLERYYTKEEIITMYLNYFDFLYNAVGIKNASRTYFGKEPIDLTLEECATFVGMCKNPSLYNPKLRPENCRERRNVVLAQMEKAGFITKEEKELAQARPIDLSNFHLASHKEGAAPYFREHLRVIMMASRPDRSQYASWQGQQFHDDSIAWENDPLYGWCNKNTKKNGQHYNIYTDGLKIYTTIDTRMQKMAEDALFEHVAKYLQPHFDSQTKYSKTGPYSGLSVSKVDGIIMKEMKRSERWRAMKASGHSDEEIISAFNTPVEMELFKYGSSYDDPQVIEATMTPRDSIIYYKRFLRSSICAMDPSNGAVKAYVPGLNFEYFQFDNILGGNKTGGRRQVGSTIKPLLYSLYITEFDETPCDHVDATAKRYGNWCPKGSSLGIVPLKSALAASNNHASAYLLNKLSPPKFIKFLSDKLKISTYSFKPNLTIALGSGDISVGEMCSAYTIFPGYGIHYSPLLVTRIEDSDGNIIANFTPRMNEVLSKEKALQMITMTQAVINEGTGRGLRGGEFSFKAQIGGKTGTTNSNADGWFIGFVPKLVIACWVGGDDRDIHFGSMAFGQGAKAALPIWGKFMKKVYNSRLFGITQDDKFDFPEGYSPCGNDELRNLPSAESILHPEYEEPTDVDEEFF
ncbi:MAG: transglycosylase domain-containing protein [Prevotellaceae bacterium]|nr:transglycosylase domain-containing protein [Candidatus Minthosoma equi]